MTTFLQLHLLTAYPPANLNRDDSGRPKTAVFGGVERARVSSQSLKRAWRTSKVFQDRVNAHVGLRTQRIGAEVKAYLQSTGMPEEKALDIARRIASLFGKVKDEKDSNPAFTEQLVFVAPEEKERALKLADRMAKDNKLEPKVTDVLLQADGAADIAMFGRMLANDPGFNREAAVQVAHAVTTHRVAVEDDYYVAVDDLKGSTGLEDSGTSFIGVQEFVSGVFYLYTCVDISLLKANLNSDVVLARNAVGALVETAAKVAPRGKQASFASRAHTSFVLAECGSDQPRTLAAAFLKPVGEREQAGDAARASAMRLTAFRDKFIEGYGAGDLQSALMDLTGEKVVGSLEGVTRFAMGCVREGKA